LAAAPPQTPLGKLIALFQTPQLDSKGPILLRGETEEKKGGELTKGKEGKEKETERKGMGEDGKGRKKSGRKRKRGRRPR